VKQGARGEVYNAPALAELGSCYGVHPTLVAQWKRQLWDALPQVFADRRQKPDRKMKFGDPALAPV
jgi:hypothetical protein